MYLRILVVCAAMVSLHSEEAFAQKNYASNVFSPIPPGCATNTQVWGSFNPSGTTTIFNGSYQATTIDGSQQTMNIRVWRKGCADPARSVLMMDIGPADDGDLETDCVLTPTLEARLPNMEIKDLRATLEPHTNFQFENLRILCEGNEASWFLDGVSVFAPIFDIQRVINPIEYNEAWTLIIKDILTGDWTLQIPAYFGNLSTSRIAFTGRLSGTWVVSGIPDQGFVLAFQEFTDVTQASLFLSWYTFDSSGKLLWLTGIGIYAWGDSEVQFSLEVLDNGQFMGTQIASRQIAGTAKVIAIGCNELRLEYNLTSLGLGSGAVTLVRILSLETQGYACSDLITRLIHEGDA